MTSTVNDAPRTERMPAEERKVLAGTLVGTSIEWYDFFIYAQAAGLVLAPLFLAPVAESNPGLAQVLAFATIGISFLFRPLGADRRRLSRRPARPQEDARVHAHPHGPVDRTHRTPADLCRDRHRRPDPADPAPHPAGLLGRWRMGRRGADGRRACPHCAPRLLRRVPADRRARRHDPRDVDAVRDHLAAHARAVHRVGLAHPVPAVDRADRRRVRHPPRRRREPDLPGPAAPQEGVGDAAPRALPSQHEDRSSSPRSSSSATTRPATCSSRSSRRTP